MQTEEETTRQVIVVCAEPGIEEEVVARSIRVQWVHSIKAAIALLDSALAAAVLMSVELPAAG